MATTDDLDAINRYFETHASDPGAQNAVAQACIRDWKTWWAGLSIWAKSVDTDETFAEAKTRRDKFNQAMGQPNLVDLGFVPLETRTPMTEADVAKTFAGGGAPPTIRKGSRGAAVTKWQQIIKVTADGNFGSGTETATKTWQKNNGLTADGVVGPLSWTKAGIKVMTDIVKPPPNLVGLTAPIPPTTPPLFQPQPPVVSAPVPAGFAPPDPPVPASSFEPPAQAAVPRPGFAPTPVPVVPKPISAPTTIAKAPTPANTGSGFKQAPAPATPAPQAVAAKPVVKPPVVQQAGMMTWFGDMPTWSKVVLGVSLAAGVVKTLGGSGPHHNKKA